MSKFDTAIKKVAKNSILGEAEYLFNDIPSNQTAYHEPERKALTLQDIKNFEQGVNPELTTAGADILGAPLQHSITRLAEIYVQLVGIKRQLIDARTNPVYSSEKYDDTFKKIHKTVNIGLKALRVTGETLETLGLEIKDNKR